jgi:hypothetical protein
MFSSFGLATLRARFAQLSEPTHDSVRTSVGCAHFTPDRFPLQTGPVQIIRSGADLFAMKAIWSIPKQGDAYRASPEKVTVGSEQFFASALIGATCCAEHAYSERCPAAP